MVSGLWSVVCSPWSVVRGPRDFPGYACATSLTGDSGRFPCSTAATLAAANWRAALDRMDTVHQALIDAVRTLDPEALDRRAPGKASTVYFMLHGIPQHDLYHGGQVVLLRKASRST